MIAHRRMSPSTRLPTTQPAPGDRASEAPAPDQLAFAILHSVSEPRRIGEIAWVAAGTTTLGRVSGVDFGPHRPGVPFEGRPMEDASISREHVTLEARGRRVTVEGHGQLPLSINGQPAATGTLRPGDVLEIGDRLVLLLHLRPPMLPNAPLHPFGAPDPDGVVGEGPASWALRAQIRFVAARDPHVLVHGPSGSGKELAARAVHRQSARSGGPWISRSASTIPASLADAELFGNLRDYPNQGMPSREGLIGAAHQGTLFLDEFGELPLELQARLLRVLDDGEYTRLGEARPRRSDLRLVAATNRPLSHIKEDVLARLPLRIVTPPLDARREDLGLLIRETLRRIVRSDPDLATRVFPDGPQGRLDVTGHLVATLARAPLRTHVRELARQLWDALSQPGDGPLALPPTPGHPTEAADAPWVDPADLDPVVVQAHLDRHQGRQEAAWRELGFSSRHALGRFVRKHGLRVRRRAPAKPPSGD